MTLFIIKERNSPVGLEVTLDGFIVGSRVGGEAPIQISVQTALENIYAYCTSIDANRRAACGTVSTAFQ